MKQDDFKKLLNKALEPIKEGLNGVRKTLNEHTKVLDEHTKILTSHSKILDEHTKILTSHSKILDEHTKIFENQVLPSVVYIEQNIKAYADMYKINNSNAGKLERRIEVLEERSGVTPPSEHILVHTQ